MYPTLYHFFYDWFGFEIVFMRAINSFGFFVAIAFLTAAGLFARELRRKYKEGLIPAQKVKAVKGKPVTIYELVINGVLGFLLGYKLVYAILNNEVFQDFPHFLASSTGNIWGGLVMAAGLAYWKYYEKKKEQLPEPQIVERDFLPDEHMGTLLLIAAVFGYVGAKLFAYLENPGDFIEFISEPFNGLTMYGGLICALLGGYIYFRRKNLPTMHFLDALAPALILAYGIGRIGCHVSGDGDWGEYNSAYVVDVSGHITEAAPGQFEQTLKTDSAFFQREYKSLQEVPHSNFKRPGVLGFLPVSFFAYDYPNNVNTDGVPLDHCEYHDKFCNHLPLPVYPTPLYEAIMCTLIFGILWFMRKRIRAMGVMFFTFLTFNGIERFLIEQIRVNVPYEILGMKITQAEIIALVFILAGIAGIIFFYKKHQRRKLPVT